MAIIISLCNQKGGTAKTTSSINLAAALVEKGKNVLLVDLDPQGGLTTSLGFNPDSLEETIYNVLLDQENTPITKVILSTNTGADLVPANIDLAAAEIELSHELGWDRTLKDSLNPIVQNYDYILIDSPPSLGILTTNALVAADKVIIPLQCEYLAMRGLRHLNRIIGKIRRKANPNLSIRILRTMHHTRALHSREVLEEVESIFGGQVYGTVIKRTIKFADASAAAQSILAYDSKSDGAVAYRQLAEEVINDT